MIPERQQRKTTKKIENVNLLPHLSAKSKQEFGNNKDDDGKDSFFGSFFKENDKKKPSIEQDDTEDSKGVPIVGRFFKSDEEKEERKRLKKKEKEKIKMNQKEKKRKERQQPQEKKRSKIMPAVKNYFEERQIRKDAEVLRNQVKQREKAERAQAEKDAEELRLEVQKREAKRKQQREQIQQKLSLAKSSTRKPANTRAQNSVVQRQLVAQKELDIKQKERRDQSENENDNKVTSSKSQRFGNAMSAAQKFVSGVFENDQKKREEWIVVAPKTRISPGEIVAVTAGGIDLLLVASKDGSAVHCVANSCPHLGTPLEVGSLERLPIETSSAAPSSNFVGDSSTDVKPVKRKSSSFANENDIARMLKEDGCEDCIVCPLHKTAFALKSGEVRGEWCPYPPVIGKITGTIVQQSNLPVFDVRTKGKNIEVRLNTPVEISDN
ncbi:unnamed protein product [Pseudo-nitzschia multistriata]|uniref:Rieske domain-containing protein n=1 Tax=Pseudo-nitzschia multistriata TaxID=183589 RepID=A0A448YVL5_9STRA|nr:unnamed protein product [Pseudo-nitzschia multistriata]